MIFLTKLDRAKILVVPETIKYIESTPDTLIRFLNGECLIVRENLEEIAELMASIRKRAQSTQSRTNIETGVNSWT